MSDTLEKPRIGRPCTYTEEIGERIALQFANGKQLTDIFREDWAPADFNTLAEWQEKYPPFASLMARARIAHTEYLVDTMTSELTAHPDPQKARLAIQIRQWKASKWSPQYADRVQLDVDHKVSINAALEAGLQRAALPVSDQDDEPQAQVIEDASYSVVTSTHQRSDDAPDLPDWMD